MLEFLEELGIRPIEKSAEQLDLQAKDECDRRAPGVMRLFGEAVKRCSDKDRPGLEQGKREYETAYNQPDYATAVTKLDALEISAKAAKEKGDTHAKNTLAALRKRDAAKIKLHEGRLDSGDYEVFFWGKRRAAAYDKEKQEANRLEAAGDFFGAVDAYRRQATQLGLFAASLMIEWKILKDDTPNIDEAIKKNAYSAYPDLVKNFTAAKGQSAPIDKAAVEESWSDATLDAFLAYHKCVADLRQAQADKLLKLQTDGKPLKDVVNEAKTLAKRDPNVFVELAKTPQGVKLLDDMVGSLEGSAGSSESKDLCKAAIRARFGLQELKGDLTKKALPKLYDVMKLVPLSHTRDNERLSSIKRDRKSEEASFYRDSDSLVVLNLGRQGKWRGDGKTSDFDHDDDVPAEYLEGQITDLDYFNETTLHEVGHAVDAKMNFMGGRVDDPKFGGWHKHKLDEIADVAAGIGNFYASFTPAPIPALKKYLLGVLQGREKSIEASGSSDKDTLAQDPALAEAVKLRTKHAKALEKNSSEDVINKHVKSAMKKTKVKDQKQLDLLSAAAKLIFQDKKLSADDAAKQVLKDADTGLPPTTDWAQLADHDAVKWCRAIRMTGSSNGLWDKGKEGTDKAIGDRVYQQAYKDDWYSYDKKARAKGVSKYQFRAPAEWFAELYAAYYMEKLSDKHPDVSWLDGEVHALSS